MNSCCYECEQFIDVSLAATSTPVIVTLEEGHAEIDVVYCPECAAQLNLSDD